MDSKTLNMGIWECNFFLRESRSIPRAVFKPDSNC